MPRISKVRVFPSEVFTGREISHEEEGARGQRRVQEREIQSRVEVEEAKVLSGDGKSVFKGR